MVVTTVATFFGGWALDLVKEKAGETLDHKLNSSTVERALKQAVSAAEKEVPELFSSYEKDGLRGIDRFLNNAFKETAIAELQKPLQNQGKPNDALLAKAFLREAESHSALGDIDPRLVEAWMRAFTEAYFQTTNSFLSYQVTKEQYYRQLRAKIGKVVFSGMAVDGTVVDEPGELAKIFVMPDVQRQNVKGYELAEMPLPEVADGQQLIQWEQQQQLRLMKGQSDRQQQPVSAVELLKSKAERVVLLGAPGAGKTTLINYWVVTAALAQTEENPSASLSASGVGQYFPILIRIRDLAREPELSVLEFLERFVKRDLEIDSVPTGFFQHWLKTGQALILLDGLDEVADDTQRKNVVGKIETFLGTCDDRCPAIITSRPAGYRDDYFSRSQYPHYELLPFDDEKIETFINHWYDSRVDLPTERERRKSSLRKALSTKPRIKQLARNPLLLTIIAVIHRYKTLPKQRHELYRSAVETLISTWDKDKELTIRPVLKYLDIRDIQRLMKQLAYWIHSQGSVDDAENGTQIERDTLIRKLGKFIQEIKAAEKLQLYQAQAEAEAFLDKIIKDRAGLLSQQGKTRYAFVHKTFQEYLCSQEILYLQEDQDPDDDDYVPHAKSHIQKHLHDPHWREVLLLLVAQQTPSPAKASLKAILGANSDYEQWLHRDLLLAGSCLAENSEVTDEATINRILTGLVNLEICSQPVVSDKLRGEVFRVISSLRDTPFAPRAMRLLETHQQTIDQWRFIDYQSELEPDKAVQKLLLLLEAADTNVRSQAAASLGQMGNTSEAVVNGLLAMLQDTAVATLVRYQAAASLGRLGNPSEAVVNGLLAVLQDTAVDTLVRSLAAASLGRLGNLSEAVVNRLLAMLQDTAVDTLARSQAAALLVHLGNASEAVVNGLLAMLQDTAADTDVRSQAAASLGHLGNASEAVVNRLLAVLQDTAVATLVRSQAAASLGRLGNTSEAVVNGLLAMLQDTAADTSVRYQAAESLVHLGNASEAVVNGLLAMLQDTAVDTLVRYQAAESLVKLGNASEAVVNGLLAMLQGTAADPYVRSQAAASLGHLGNASDAVVNGLLAMLQDTAADIVNPFVRYRAAQSLVALSKHSGTILPALVQWIEQHQHEDYVDNGIDVLWELMN